MKLYPVAQSEPDFEGYHSQEVPQEVVNLVGTGGTVASQILMLFPKADKSIQLVNEFDASLLSDVAYIFNFDKGGAYGVYLDALDKAIKTEELKQALEQSGYKVVMEAGELKAYPGQDQKTQEEIQQDIDIFYKKIESSGGAAFGINMGSILDLSRDSANSSNSPDPNLWEWIAMLHVGSTIAHEATHAKGHEDESMPQQVEHAFEEWALQKLNIEYQQYWESSAELNQHEFMPIQFTGEKIHASNKGWYKEAQHFFQQMQFQRLQNSPKGSDIEGRFPSNPHGEKGRGGWGKMMQLYQDWPIESRLGREYMFPLPEGLSQEHDSTEEQLRKFRQYLEPFDTTATTEELLSESHDDGASYKPTEELLEEGRPTPLLVPLEKSASMIKNATTFGWMNNLEISDGRTIPGLGDRVMAWEDRDEDFSEDEMWIKKQPRYNPVYDLKGFFFRWIEPRYKPTLFDDPNEDISNIHPARRFASSEDEAKAEMLEVMSVLSHAKERIMNTAINATRFIVSEDMLDIMHKIFDATEEINLYISKLNFEEEILYAAWLSTPRVDLDVIIQLENKISNGTPDVKTLQEIDRVCGYSINRTKVIKEVVFKTRRACKKHGMSKVFILGNYPKAMAMKEPIHTVESLDFSGTSKAQVRKLGSLMAKTLGVDDSNIYYGKSVTFFYYKGLRVEFNSRFQPDFIQDRMLECNLKINTLSLDVFNRDFTINMLAYSLLERKLYDMSKRGMDDVASKTVRTYFDPCIVLEQNPAIILRALKLHVQYGFTIDENLKYAMYIHGEKLFNGDISTDLLLSGRGQIMQEGEEQAIELFHNYGIEEILNY